MEHQLNSCIVKRIQCLPPHTSTPFFVCDLRTVRAIYKAWTQCLPGVKPFYSVKTNNDVGLLAGLAKLGSNFDCASIAEMEQVLGLGVSTDRIILANPVKTIETLLFAKENAIKSMTFDSLEELAKIKTWFPDANLILRIKTYWEHAVVDLSTKFGANVEGVEALLLAGKEMGLNCVGVSFHVGTGVNDSNAYLGAVATAEKVLEIGKNLGISMELLDIGGGFVPSSFAKVSCEISTALTQLFPPELGLRLLGEPGRLFSEDAFVLVCNVYGLKKSSIPCGRIQLYQSDGIYQSFSAATYEKTVYRPSYVIRRHGEHLDVLPVASGTFEYTIWGPTCDSLDCVTPTFNSKVEIEMGDWLVYEKMGAYGRVAGTSFNGIACPEVVAYIE